MAVSNKKRTVLITGCSSGLGAALVQYCLDMGLTVYATVRNRQRCGELEPLLDHTCLHVCELDVCNAAAVARLVDDIHNSESGIDALVINAGRHVSEVVESLTQDQVDNVFGSNFYGALNCLQAVVPLMRKQKGGRIIGISSLSAQVGLPCDGLYSASKAAMERILESLRAELAAFGVDVSVVVPATFPSRLLQTIQRQALDKASSYYPLMSHIQKGFVANAGGSVDSVARVVAGLLDGRSADFRVPADKVAESVLKQIYQMNEADRRAAIEKWSDTAWWPGSQL